MNASKDPSSRIPVPSSPLPVRRSSSLRLAGGGGAPCQAVRSAHSRQTSRRQSSSHGSLERSHSFMEQVGPTRPDSVNIVPKGPVTPHSTPQQESPPRIRSLSLSLSNTKLQSSPRSPSARPVVVSSPNQTNRHFSSSNTDRWEADSVSSLGSVASCDHASVARNGTTFSGRSMKYVFHCNQHAGATGEDYLTPTQRAQRQVKKLKYLLHQAKRDLEQKDSDVLKLTKEVVELKLYKAALSSPEDKSNSSDAITVRENTSEETTPEDLIDKGVGNHVTSELNNSFADSGHFEDCANSSVHSKDSAIFDDHRSPSKYRTVDKAITANLELLDADEIHSKIMLEYEKRIQELVRTHEEESFQMKQKHNDRIEELLQRINEINTRYWQLVPELETAKERIKELEYQLEEASKKLDGQEQVARETYEKMYAQGKEAARMERENTVMELAHQNPSRISVPELLQELQVTKNELDNIRDLEYASTSNHSQPFLSAKEALSLWVLGARKAMYRQLMEAKSKNKIDPEITLQFLKSAVYYFLTDKENSQGHLRAIQSILGFSQSEVSNIDKAWFNNY